MKELELNEYFKRILELTKGDNTSDRDIIDYENGFSISKEEVREEYYKYKELEAEIDTYIEENDLDDVKDQDKIKEHFAEYKECFIYNQACLLDFPEFLVKKFSDKLN